MHLEIEDLRITIEGEEAVRSSSFSVPEGSITALIGESGGGKSLTAKAIAGLMPRRAKAEGHILLDGQDLLAMSERERDGLRGKGIAYVFQDAAASLNPVYTISRQLSRITKKKDNSAALRSFGLEGSGGKYPFELSGGMQMRAELMLASSLSPALLIADEITAALDNASVLSILTLLRRGKPHDGSILLITHDIRRAAAIADRIVVMHAGVTVEEGDRDEVLLHPMHPYTEALLRCSRLERTAEGELWAIPGTMPLPGERIEGCTFRTRCPSSCQDTPAWQGTSHHRARCSHPLHVLS